MAVQREEFRHVKADATRSDNRHALAHRFAMAQHIDVRQHARMILPRDLRIARRHARRDDDLVVLGRKKLLRIHACTEAQRHARRGDATGEVTQHLMKLFFTRDRLGHVQLAAEFRCRVEQVHGVPTLGQCDRRG